jgi:hypothetical protein
MPSAPFPLRPAAQAMPLPERTLSFSAAAAGAEGSGTPAGGP